MLFFYPPDKSSSSYLVLPDGASIQNYTSGFRVCVCTDGDKAPNLDVVEHGLKLLQYIQYLDLIIRLESLGLPKRRKRRREIVN